MCLPHGARAAYRWPGSPVRPIPTPTPRLQASESPLPGSRPVWCGDGGGRKFRAQAHVRESVQNSEDCRTGREPLEVHPTPHLSDGKGNTEALGEKGSWPKQCSGFFPASSMESSGIRESHQVEGEPGTMGHGGTWAI